MENCWQKIKKCVNLDVIDKTNTQKLIIRR